MVHRAQSEDRGHRKGTRLPVTIIDLCVPDSIDGEIRMRVTQKRKAALEIQDCRIILKKLFDFRPINSIGSD